jgi:hypothetical protein
VYRDECASYNWGVETSICFSDESIDLRESQVLGKPVARVKSHVNAPIGTVIEVLHVLGVFDEAYPAEVVAALFT